MKNKNTVIDAKILIINRIKLKHLSTYIELFVEH